MIRTITCIVVAALWAGGSLSALAQPNEEERRFKLARSYEESGNIVGAARIYLELHEADRLSNEYFQGVARTFSALNRFNDLLPIVEAWVEEHSKDIQSRILYAGVLNRVNRREEALHQWNEAIALRPDDQITYAMVAQSQSDNRLFEAAVSTYRQARSRTGDPDAFAVQMAQLYGILGKFQEASEEYLTLLSSNPGQLNYVISGMAVFTANPKGAGAAVEATRNALERKPDYMPYYELLSWLYTEQKNYRGAFEIARKQDEIRNGRGSSVYGFADGEVREGRYETAIEAFEYFLDTYDRSNPLYMSVLYHYTQALELRYREQGAGSVDEAERLVERYRKIASEFSGTEKAAEAQVQVARLLAEDLDRPGEAIETLERVRAEYEKFALLPDAMLLEGDLQLRVGNLERAREIYQLGREQLSTGPSSTRFRDLYALRLAETYFYVGEFKKAVDAFTELTQNTQSDAANDALQYLFILQENFEKYDEALKHYAAGRLLLLQQRWEEAEEEMAQAASSPSPLGDEALLGKARAEEAMGDTEKAVATLLTAVEKYSNGMVADRCLFHAAEIVEKQGDVSRAIELYTRILTEYPTSHFTSRARAQIRRLRGES